MPGYGNLTPSTDLGKLVTMLYALVGIPLMFIYMANIGTVLASSFKFLYSKAEFSTLIGRAPTSLALIGRILIIRSYLSAIKTQLGHTKTLCCRIMIGDFHAIKNQCNLC